MENTMELIMKDILKMPYYKNYAAASGLVHNLSKHEDAVEDIFNQFDFKKIEIPEINVALRDVWRKGGDHSILLNNSYISQPCGKNNNPDFIVKNEFGKIFFIECKSGKDTTPLYNSGGIKMDYIYIFTSKKEKGTTIYLGEDIMCIQQDLIIKNIDIEVQQVVEEGNNLLRKNDINHRGVHYYPRRMIGQRGGKTYANYFTHIDRVKSEQRVLNFVKYNTGEQC